MAESNRPLSPHLQVYRLPLTGLISITHRATGVFLSIGMVIFVAGLVAVALGADSFAGFQSFIGSFFGYILLYGWLISLLFHLCHGVRHLIWDGGMSFDKAEMDRFAMMELIATAGIFILTIVLALLVG